MARHNIPVDTGRGRQMPVDVILDETMEAQFDVIPEAVPPGLPTTYQGRLITWVSNFRVQKKPWEAKTGKKLHYSIELDAPDGQLVYFDESTHTIIPLTTRPLGNNRIQADLSAEDPAIGGSYSRLPSDPTTDAPPPTRKK